MPSSCTGLPSWSLSSLTMHIDERVKPPPHRCAATRVRTSGCARPPRLLSVCSLPPWTIRTATDEDRRSVLDLWRRAGGTPGVSDTPEALTLLLAGRPRALLLADAGGAVLGALIAAWDGWRGSFYRLAVDLGQPPSGHRHGTAAGGRAASGRAGRGSAHRHRQRRASDRACLLGGRRLRAPAGSHPLRSPGARLSAAWDVLCSSARRRRRPRAAQRPSRNGTRWFMNSLSG